MLKVIKPTHAWQLGPGRACSWPGGLPLPGHRDMAQVMAAQRRKAEEAGALAFARAKREEALDEPTR